MQSKRFTGWYWLRLTPTLWTGGNPTFPGVCVQAHKRAGGWAGTCYRKGGHCREFDSVRAAVSFAEF